MRGSRGAKCKACTPRWWSVKSNTQPTAPRVLSAASVAHVAATSSDSSSGISYTKLHSLAAVAAAMPAANTLAHAVPAAAVSAAQPAADSIDPAGGAAQLAAPPAITTLADAAAPPAITTLADAAAPPAITTLADASATTRPAKRQRRSELMSPTLIPMPHPMLHSWNWISGVKSHPRFLNAASVSASVYDALVPAANTLARTVPAVTVSAAQAVAYSPNPAGGITHLTAQLAAGTRATTSAMQHVAATTPDLGFSHPSTMLNYLTAVATVMPAANTLARAVPAAAVSVGRLDADSSTPAVEKRNY